jgi:hypothetical protein
MPLDLTGERGNREIGEIDVAVGLKPVDRLTRTDPGVL